MALSDSIYGVIQNPSYKGVLGAIGDVTQSVGSITKKIRSINSDEMTPKTIRDYNTSGFLSQDSLFKPSFFARMFDEPTYLTFRIEFMFNDPTNEARNTAYNNSGILDSALSNAYYPVMYDHMPEPFLDDYLVTGGFDTSTGKRYSAETYLDLNLGDHGRAQILHNFKMALRDIEVNFPYYFTSIGGIDSLVKVKPSQGARLKDCAIELECIEGLDLKITQLLQMYRKIVWDDVYQRWILPDMMRYFGMRIYISEMRLFSSTKKEKDKGPKTYDFSDTDQRNMTYADRGKKHWTEKTRDIINQGNVISQAFLGTKSVITQALDYTASTLTTIDEGYRNIAGAFNQIQYCNNAIDEVMPTICFECHMCEFDIEDTMSHINTLSSSNKNSNELKPKIKINIGQVKEIHAYPLNVALIGSDENGYPKTIKDYKEVHNIPKNSDFHYEEYADLYDDRGAFASDNTYHPGKLTFSGNFISDITLNRRYASEDLGKRIAQYVWQMSTDFGYEKGQTISEKRFTSPNSTVKKKTIDVIDKMSYRPDDLPNSTAAAGLFTAGMNEALSIASKVGVSSDIIGTRSLATDQTSSVKQSLQAVGDAMMLALDRVYNGQEMRSMAAQGVSELDRARIAGNSFNAFVESLEKSTATQDPIMKAFLQNYRRIENSEYISKATNTTFSNLN